MYMSEMSIDIYPNLQTVWCIYVTQFFDIYIFSGKYYLYVFTNWIASTTNKMAALLIPKCIGFFLNSLVRIMQGARSYLFTDQVNSAEFFCHRLNVYERTLRLLLARLEELSPKYNLLFDGRFVDLTRYNGDFREALDDQSLRGHWQVRYFSKSLHCRP